MSQDHKPEYYRLSDAELAARKRRNLWLALALVAFVVLVGVTTALRLGDSELGPDGGLYWRMDDGGNSRPADTEPAGAPSEEDTSYEP